MRAYEVDTPSPVSLRKPAFMSPSLVYELVSENASSECTISLRYAALKKRELIES